MQLHQRRKTKHVWCFFFSWGLQTNTLKMRSGQASRPFCMEKHIGSLHGNTRNPMAWLQGELGQGPRGQRGNQWGKKSSYISHIAAHLRPDWAPNTASNILWTSFFQNNQQRTSLRGAWPSWKPCNHKSIPKCIPRKPRRFWNSVTSWMQFVLLMRHMVSYTTQLAQHPRGWRETF